MGGGGCDVAEAVLAFGFVEAAAAVVVVDVVAAAAAGDENDAGGGHALLAGAEGAGVVSSTWKTKTVTRRKR